MWHAFLSAHDITTDIVPRHHIYNLHYISVCSLLCKCASFPASEVERQELILETVEYSESVLELLSDGKYDTREDFTVVAQPFFVNQRLPTTSVSLPTTRWVD